MSNEPAPYRLDIRPVWREIDLMSAPYTITSAASIEIARTEEGRRVWELRVLTLPARRIVLKGREPTRDEMWALVHNHPAFGTDWGLEMLMTLVAVAEREEL